MQGRKLLRYFLPLVVLGLPLPLQAQDDFLDLEIDKLVEVKITSVTKTENTLYDSPAAIFVLTQEDIRRSSANTIPELLRLVPGLHVAQINDNSYAISARGFQHRLANKMLVMIDGRSVYTAGFGGVYWGTVDVPLNDIERIEVIRGPGGSAWGVNAVNGVIHITTKNASDTIGWNVRAGAGDKDQAFGSVRFGESLSENSSFRLYASGDKKDTVESPENLEEIEGRSRQLFGFRIDSEVSEHSNLSVLGSFSEVDAEVGVSQALTRPPFNINVNADADSSLGNFLTRYEIDTANGQSGYVQFYFDYTDIRGPVLDEEVFTYDLDSQHNIALSDMFAFSYGLNARVYDHTFSDQLATATPESESIFIGDLFVNLSTHATDSLEVTLGSKVGYNDYTNVEAQPSLRALYKLNNSNRLWFAVSRAVRIPHRTNRGIQFPTATIPNPDGSITSAEIRGNTDLDAEVLWAYEVGYRSTVSRSLFLDVAGFYNIYDDLIGSEPGTPMPATSNPGIVLPINQSNNSELHTYGGEVSLQYSPCENLRLIGSYSFLDADTNTGKGVQGVNGANSAEFFVRNQATLRSLLTLSEEWEVDLTGRYVDSKAGMGVGSYTEIDVRLGWSVAPQVELSLVGMNLLDSGHSEHVDVFDAGIGVDGILIGPAFEVERSVYWRLDVDS